MISMLVMIKRKAGMSKEQFREYYETNHVALAKKHTAHLFADYRRNYVNSAVSLANWDDSAATQQSPYDVITTIVFENQTKCDEFFRLVSRPEIKKAFADDEANFMDRNGSILMMCDNVKT